MPTSSGDQSASEAIWSESGGWFDAKTSKKNAQAKADADQAAANAAATKKAITDEESIAKNQATIGNAIDKINWETKKGAEKEVKAGEKYNKETEGLKEETKGLKKYTEGLETNYEKIAQRYRDAFDEADKLRVKEQALAQRDYAANTALMSKAASVGMSGQGPMTGAQQQLMMAGAQQQATSAYSTASDRMQAMQMQRQQLGEKAVSASMQQELQNRQAGYNMDAQGIQARNVLNTQQYGTNMYGISSTTNAEISGQERLIGLENSGFQKSIALRGMREGVAMSEAQIAAAGGGGQSQLGTGIQRGVQGVMAGMATGNPWVAAGTGLLGFISPYMEGNK